LSNVRSVRKERRVGEFSKTTRRSARKKTLGELYARAYCS
jgi:hypothetical protein